ncbi:MULTISPECIES: IS21 family transposase [unclassified Dietzia]|uniref:IS21 family transposase n=1 Tax=unclassified Dietzia TaxID=2617939 RepID=UPI0012E6F92C|nr:MULTISPECIES: IS21 family transposase [unclassified Dietzia]
MIAVEQWAEIRRLHNSEGVPIKEISRRLGIARNTVRSALASSEPPKYKRAPKGSLADAFEPEIRKLLAEYPTMPATVIAERIAWPHSMTVLKDRVRAIRPEYRGIDPADRIEHKPGDTTQCDLWFPKTPIPLGAGQSAQMPVLVMTLAFSRYISATMIPSRMAGDILAGMWLLLGRLGAVTHRLWWDRESAIATSAGKPTVDAAAFAGTLSSKLVIAPPRDPEFKGMVERHNGYLGQSFMAGRTFTGPDDFNDQLTEWLETANSRTVRVLGTRPVDALVEDRARMLALPPVAPATGLRTTVRLARDYYVRIDSVDYSVDPRVIGRLVEVVASLHTVTVTCAGTLVAEHRRSWSRRGTVTNPEHVELAKQLRVEYWQRTREQPPMSSFTDPVVRSLRDYDDLYDVDFAGNAALDSEVSA